MGNPLDTSQLIALVVIVVVVASIPLLIVGGNVYYAFRSYRERQRVFGDLLAKGGDRDDKKTEMLIREYTSMKPIGLEGTARSAMTVSIIVILGVTLAYLLINPGEDNSTVKDVLLILSGAVSSIVGFYFGGRAGDHDETPPSKEAEDAPEKNPNGTGKPNGEGETAEGKAQK